MEHPTNRNCLVTKDYKSLVCQRCFVQKCQVACQVTYNNDVMFYFHQEEEKRIASVMARKEEEKKKEISKLAVLKVVFSVNFPYNL